MRVPTRSRPLAPLLIAALLALPAHPSAAQTSRSITAGQLGRFSYDGGSVMVATVRHTGAPSTGGWAGEVGIGALLGEGFLVMPELSVVWAPPTDGVQIRPRAGLSAFGWLGPGAMVVPGVHAGAALLVPAGATSSLRLDGAVRRASGGHAFFEVSVGVAVGGR